MELPLAKPAADSVLLTRAALAFLLFGFLLRATRYLLGFPLWGDETMLAVNFLDRGYLELARPLDCLQISPILFSWIELTATKALGFSAFSLRLFPFVCGLASLLLFWRLAKHYCHGVAAPLSMGIFAVAYFLVRHPAEIKPYSSDLFSALLLMWLAVRIEATNERKWWLLLIGATPFLVLLSYPVVFTAGGVSLFLLASGKLRSFRSFWLPWGLFNLALVGAFLGNYSLIAAAHYVRTYTQGVGAMWVEGWPPVTQPLELFVWAVREHTGRMFAYPVGGKNGASTATAILVFVGIWLMARNHGSRRHLVLFLVPFGLAFIAAALQRYPYGGSARTMLFVAPAICLLAGMGGGALIERIKDESHQRRCIFTAFAILAIIGGASFIRDVLRPYKTAEDARLEQFAQWFWTDYAGDCQLVCAGSDLGKNFYGKNWNEAAHDYLCWQRMYSARHRAGLPPNWHAITAEHPLKVVLFHVTQSPADSTKLASWLDEMAVEYELTGREALPVNAHADLVYARTYEVLTFVPKAAQPRSTGVARN